MLETVASAHGQMDIWADLRALHTPALSFASRAIAVLELVAFTLVKASPSILRRRLDGQGLVKADTAIEDSYFAIQLVPTRIAASASQQEEHPH
ncbi:MAG: hypothetical protein AAGF92_21755 [Myxococcota bacterium]